MKSKGFTLAELLGTVVILSIIAIIAFPSILGLLNSSQEKIDKSMKDYAINATKKYVNDNMDLFPKALETDTNEKKYGDDENIKIQSLIDKGYITISYEKNCQMLNDYITVTSDSKKYNYKYVEVEGDC